MTNFAMPRLMKSAIAAGALLGLGGCMYGSSGYYGDGYVNNNGYDCDPYASFDDYYACDYGYGFANIGYGGGWYNQYYYPGYGVYMFDRGGRRHAMRDNDRRYWARQRADYGGHHARDRNHERRADRRDQRNDYRDDTRNPRRGNYRDNSGRRSDLDTRPGTRASRPDRAVETAPVRNRGDRTARPDRRPTGAVEQPQARPQRSVQPARTSSSPRPEGPRISPRNSRDEPQRVQDD